jgi:hypothetical protein
LADPELAIERGVGKAKATFMKKFELTEALADQRVDMLFRVTFTSAMRNICIS